MVPWMFWSYTRDSAPYASAGPLQAPTDANVNHTMIKTLARPYPQLVAGTPTSWSFNPATSVFSLRYSTRRAGGHGRFLVEDLAGAHLEVDVVERLHRPEGLRDSP